MRRLLPALVVLIACGAEPTDQVAEIEVPSACKDEQGNLAQCQRTDEGCNGAMTCLIDASNCSESAVRLLAACVNDAGCNPLAQALTCRSFCEPNFRQCLESQMGVDAEGCRASREDCIVDCPMLVDCAG